LEAIAKRKLKGTSGKTNKGQDNERTRLDLSFTKDYIDKSIDLRNVKLEERKHQSNHGTRSFS
jgi:hypothetical protein